MHRAVVAIAVVGAWVSVAAAQPVAVQGRVLSAGGVAVDGQYDLTLAFYADASEGAPLYEETLAGVQVAAGVFSASVALPAGVALAADELWLGVTVAGEPELARTRVGAVPYALVSRFQPAAEDPAACSAARLGATYFNTTTQDVRVCDGVAWGAVTVGAAVVIPQSPDAFLKVATDFIASLPGKGSEAFVPPTALERAVFGAAVDATLQEDLAHAATLAKLVGYELALTADDVRLLRPTDANARGLFALRKSATRAMLIASPHPKYDGNTGLRGAEIFDAIGARGYAVAGSHRCANTTPTTCSGTTTACGSPAKTYPNSDQAHTTLGFFQVFHARLGLTTLQIHGMASDADDPEFSFSDGTSTNTADPGHLGNLLTTDLETRIAAAGSLKPGNSCNRAGDINKLCGGTNVQGRLSNGVPAKDACLTSAAAATNTFFHLELSKDLRTKGGTLEPTLLVESILAVF